MPRLGIVEPLAYERRGDGADIRYGGELFRARREQRVDIVQSCGEGLGRFLPLLPYAVCTEQALEAVALALL